MVLSLQNSVDGENRLVRLGLIIVSVKLTIIGPNLTTLPPPPKLM